MRKQYRVKKRACALCKPHKMGWEKRWKAKEQQRILVASQEIRTVVGNTVVQWK